MSKVLAVVGMHRSGTSLMANWLAHCGLHVGDELIVRPNDNPTGHYEDKAFVMLHIQILEANGLDHLVTGDAPIVIGEDHKAQAERLIAERRNDAAWGWKDPRTALFLPFWKSLLPDMKALVVYRDYAQVVDSLLRRRLRRLQHNQTMPRLKKLRAWLTFRYLNRSWRETFLHTWIRYNQDILRYVEANPDDSLVIHVEDLLPHSLRIIDFLNGAWGFELARLDIQTVFVSDMLSLNQTRLVRMQPLARLAPECDQVYQELMGWRERALSRLS